MLSLSRAMGILVRVSAWCLVAAGAAFWCTPNASGADDCTEAALPAMARQALHARFPDYKVVTLTDLLPDDANLWRAHHPRDCPGMVAGRFGPKYEGYAVSLTRPLDANRYGAALVLLVHRKGRYSVVVLIPDSLPVAQVSVVWTMPAGTYEDAERLEKIRTRWPLVIYEAIETGSLAYYWKDGKFRSFTMSE